MSQDKVEINNQQLTEKLKSLFAYNELMFAYYCGSRAYGTTDTDSDLDVVAVFSDLNGITHAAFNGIDIFAYGIDSFIQRQSISDELPLYNIIHADDFLRAEENLIFLNPVYEEDFRNLLSIKFKNVLSEYLNAFIEYYDLIINKQKSKVKRSYHIYRVKAIIDNYKKTKEYDVLIPKETVDKILNYKKNWETMNDSVILEFSNILAEIKTFKDSLSEGEINEN